MENQERHNVLLRKYICGESTPEETGQVLEWLSTPEGTEALKNSMDAAGSDAFGEVPGLPPKLSTKIYARLKQHRDGAAAPDADRGSRASARRPVWSGLYSTAKKWRVAAALIGLLLLAGGAYLLAGYHAPTYATKAAQKEVIVLPDHSTVTLNGNSSLRVLGDWEKGAVRKVLLEGEAFFDVVPNKEKPFIVVTSDIGIKVLGTSFNVKSYDEEATVETTLVSGKVVIDLPGGGNHRGPLVLRPNQKATYTKESSSIALDQVDTRLYTSWKSGMLIFDDRPFAEIAKELERWYGVRIKLLDETSAQCRFTIKISDEPLLEVLDLFSSTSAASYSVDDDQITIKGELCP